MLDDDFILIQEIDSNENQKLVAYLTGPDDGPKSEAATSNWDMKIISISTTQMNIEFKSDDYLEAKGFSANIHFTPIPNNECDSWLDMNQNVFKSELFGIARNSRIGPESPGIARNGPD